MPLCGRSVTRVGRRLAEEPTGLVEVLAGEGTDPAITELDCQRFLVAIVNHFDVANLMLGGIRRSSLPVREPGRYALKEDLTGGWAQNRKKTPKRPDLTISKHLS